MRLLLFCFSLCLSIPPAHAQTWQPPAGGTEIALWPDRAKIAQPVTTGPEGERSGGGLVADKPWHAIENVTTPTMTVYPAKGPNTGAGVLVFPGGGYEVLAIDLEGTEICDWFTSKGMTCAVLKYRVPNTGPRWNRDCKCEKPPTVPMALQDAQRAMSILRQRSGEWGIQPSRIGVIGFSAGGHLVAAISTAAARAYPAVDAADKESSRPNFAIALYSGHLWTDKGGIGQDPELGLAKDITVTGDTPPTFLLHSQTDPVDDVRNSIAYYLALKAAHVRTEMHLYAQGGHAFGLRRNGFPISDWTPLVARWLSTIDVLPRVE